MFKNQFQPVGALFDILFYISIQVPKVPLSARAHTALFHIRYYLIESRTFFELLDLNCFLSLTSHTHTHTQQILLKYIPVNAQFPFRLFYKEQCDDNV